MAMKINLDYPVGINHLFSMMATIDQDGEYSSYFDDFKAYENYPYHPTQNPNGIIQMGLAENKVYINFQLLIYILLSFLFFFQKKWFKKNIYIFSICIFLFYFIQIGFVTVVF